MSRWDQHAVSMAEPERGWRYELANVLILNKALNETTSLFFSKPYRFVEYVNGTKSPPDIEL